MFKRLNIQNIYKDTVFKTNFCIYLLQFTIVHV